VKQAVVLLSVLGALSAACVTKPPIDPLKLEGNMLTVTNQSSSEWRNVDIRLNTYFGVRTASIRSRGVLRVPLDTFAAGFGQRFNFHRMQIRDLRLTATLPDGKPLELKKKFEKGGLDGALEGLGGSR
jgi:hypothetical protein